MTTHLAHYTTSAVSSNMSLAISSYQNCRASFRGRPSALPVQGWYHRSAPISRVSSGKPLLRAYRGHAFRSNDGSKGWESRSSGLTVCICNDATTNLTGKTLSRSEGLNQILCRFLFSSRLLVVWHSLIAGINPFRLQVEYFTKTL